MKAHFTISIKKIRELDADIYVIQEVNNPKNKDADYEEFMKNSILLLYDNEEKSGNNKGIAVVAKEGIRLKNNHWDYEYNDFLSVRVNDSFDLVAVWTHKKDKASSKEYVDRMEKYLEDHDEEFINSENLIICGDFNIDISLKEQEGQNKYIELLNKYGYESIYHKLNDKEFGEESVKTYYFKYDGKEYASAVMFMPTEDLAKLCSDGGPLMGLENKDSKITLISGGYPLFYNNKCVGGIGVGGGRDNEDNIIALHIITVFQKIIKEKEED